MRKLFSKLAFMLVVALVMGLGVALPAMANPPMATELRKILLMPEHVVLNENMTFTFNFAPSGHTFALPFADPGGPGSFPITVQAGTASGVATSNNTAIIAALEALVIASDITGPNALTAGTYDWIVSENNTGQTDVAYDNARFLMRVHFSNNLDAQGQPEDPNHLNIFAVEVFPITSAPDVVPPVYDGSDAAKLENLTFTNRFAPQDIGNDTDPTRPALAVTKEITGDRAYANLNTAFNFTMTLNAPTFNPPITGVTPVLGDEGDIIEAEIVDSTGTVIGTVEFVVAADGLTATPAAIPPTNHHFQLRDGETLRFPTLPGGTTYTVTEAATANFAGQVTITVAGSVTSVVPPGTDPPVNEAVTGSGAVSNATGGDPPALLRNAADFTNAYHRTPPTGLVIANMPFFAAGAALLALALMMTSRSRKRIEEMPIAY